MNETPEGAETLVRRFLGLMEARDLEAAEALMAPGARIVFPGGRVFTSQRAMVAAAGGRYQWVRKEIAAVESFPQADRSIVYVRGDLYGVNRFGVAFTGIRFVDRFVLHRGRIVSQEVWNDLAESGVLQARNGPPGDPPGGEP